MREWRHCSHQNSLAAAALRKYETHLPVMLLEIESPSDDAVVDDYDADEGDEGEVEELWWTCEAVCGNTRSNAYWRVLPKLRLCSSSTCTHSPHPRLYCIRRAQHAAYHFAGVERPDADSHRYVSILVHLLVRSTSFNYRWQLIRDCSMSTDFPAYCNVIKILQKKNQTLHPLHTTHYPHTHNALGTPNTRGDSQVRPCASGYPGGPTDTGPPSRPQTPPGHWGCCPQAGPRGSGSTRQSMELAA